MLIILSTPVCYYHEVIMFVPGLENFGSIFSSYGNYEGYDVLRGTSLSHNDFDLMLDVEHAQNQSLLNLDIDRYYNQLNFGLNGCDVSMRMAEYLQNGGSSEVLTKLYDMSLYPNVSLTPGMEGFMDTMKNMWQWILKQIEKFRNWLGSLFKSKEASAEAVMKNAEDAAKKAEQLEEEHPDADTSELDKGTGEGGGKMQSVKEAASSVRKFLSNGAIGIGKFLGKQAHRAVSSEYREQYAAERDSKKAIKQFNKDTKAYNNMVDDVNANDTRAAAFYKAYNAVKSVKVVDVSQLGPALELYKTIVDAVYKGIDPQYIEDIQKGKDLKAQIAKFKQVNEFTAKQLKDFKSAFKKMQVEFDHIVPSGPEVGKKCVEYARDIGNYVSEFSKLDHAVVAKTFDDRIKALSKAANTLSDSNMLAVKRGDIVGEGKIKGKDGQQQYKQDTTNREANNELFDKTVNKFTSGDDKDRSYIGAAAKERLEFCRTALKTLAGSAKNVKTITQIILEGLNDSCDAIKLVIEVVNRYLAIKGQSSTENA